LSFLLIIGLLDHRLKGNCQYIKSSNKYYSLYKGLDLDVIARAESLEKAKNQLCFKEGSLRVEVIKTVINLKELA
jgi:hypothetical protein